MVNPDSTLYAEHPDWVVGQPTRPRREYRQQYVLDTLQPAVAEFVLDVVDRTLAENPGISYLKWDANRPLTDPGSPALARDRQANYWVDHVRATWDLMATVAERHPEQTLMLCASGGGRVDLGSLRWFHEVWLSDNTDPVDRVRMQWGASHFLPANVVGGPRHPGGRPAHRLRVRGRHERAVRLRRRLRGAQRTRNSAVCRRAVALYREVRPLVQQGDLWRLLPPGRALPPCRTCPPTATQAVVFGFQLADGTAGDEAQCAWVGSGRRDVRRSRRSTSPRSARTAPSRAVQRRGADGTWPCVAAQRGLHCPNLGAPGHLTLGPLKRGRPPEGSGRKELEMPADLGLRRHPVGGGRAQPVEDLAARRRAVRPPGRGQRALVAQEGRLGDVGGERILRQPAPGGGRVHAEERRRVEAEQAGLHLGGERRVAGRSPGTAA